MVEHGYDQRNDLMELLKPILILDHPNALMILKDDHG